MIVITGATGHTGSKLTQILINKGLDVRVIGRSAEKLRRFEQEGAQISVGDQGDPLFFAQALQDADALYLLIPPKLDAPDVVDYYNTVGEAAVRVIRDSRIKKVVFLSSMGAQLEAGTGVVVGLHNVERKLNSLEKIDVAVIRAGYFMENLLWSANLIQSKGINGSTISPHAAVYLVATKDISAKAVDLLTSQTFRGRQFIDLYGDKLTPVEITSQIGSLINVPNLAYEQFTDSETAGNYISMGFSESVAWSYIELSHALSSGAVYPTTIDKIIPNCPTRFIAFVKETFAPYYQSLTK